jgi:hypothetical protein
MSNVFAAIEDVERARAAFEAACDTLAQAAEEAGRVRLQRTAKALKTATGNTPYAIESTLADEARYDGHEIPTEA